MEEIVVSEVVINECWRSIDGYINYQVSNVGRVRNANTGRMLKPGLTKDGYHQVILCNNDGRRCYQVHKLVAQEFLERPEDTEDYEVDHINRNGTDNQVCNLRYSTRQQNNMNRSKMTSRITSSKFKGVSFFKDTNKWRAQIYYNKKKVSLGLFSDEQDAARAYDLKAQELFGEFAVLNFPVD